MLIRDPNQEHKQLSELHSFMGNGKFLIVFCYFIYISNKQNQEYRKYLEQMEYEVEGNQRADICCRICLQQSPKENMLTPCNCKGSTQHVHQSCLMEWASKNDKAKYNEAIKIYELQCEICKFMIPLARTSTTQINSCSQICEKIRQQKLKFVIKTGSLLAFIVSLVYFVRQFQTSLGNKNQIVKYIALVGFVLASIGMLFLILKLLFYYCIQEKQEFQFVKSQTIKNVEVDSAIQFAQRNYPVAQSNAL